MMPFSMALPTTPTRSAASGKTQKMSILLIGLTLRRSNQELPHPEVYIGDVLEGEGKIQFLPVFLSADHEDFVGCSLEAIHHHSDDPTCVVYGRQADQVSHVELSLSQRIKLLAVEQELFASKGSGFGPALDAFEVEQEAFRGLPGG